MSGHHEKARRHTTVGNGDAREFRGRNGRRHTRNDLEGNASVPERNRLFGTAAEDEWIAALQANHTLPLASGADHQAVDRLLADARAPGTLADAEALRFRERAQRDRVDQRVVEHEVGLVHTPHGAHSPQFRVAGTGTDQRDKTRVTCAHTADSVPRAIAAVVRASARLPSSTADAPRPLRPSSRRDSLAAMRPAPRAAAPR